MEWLGRAATSSGTYITFLERYLFKWIITILMKLPLAYYRFCPMRMLDKAVHICLQIHVCVDQHMFVFLLFLFLFVCLLACFIYFFFCLLNKYMKNDIIMVNIKLLFLFTYLDVFTNNIVLFSYHVLYCIRIIHLHLSLRPT